MDTCAKHPHEPGQAICRRCGGSWCNDCLVYSFGPNKPPYCMGCAMVAGGVRSAAARPAMPKRELKALLKAAKLEAKAARGKPAPETPGGTPLVTAAPDGAPAEPPAQNWDQHWWEEPEPSLAD